MAVRLLPLTEKAFMRQVTDLATLCHWTHYHTRDSRGSVAGFPDLVLLRPPRLIFAELKRKGSWATLEQSHWLALLRQISAVEVHLWTVADWDRIVEILR
jgi:hypothetical protein